MSNDSNDSSTIIEQKMPLTETSTARPGISSQSSSAKPIEMIKTTTSSSLKVKNRVKKIGSRWMERSSFKKHFNFLYLNNRKRAKCIYCGKMFKEGESTGNLSKHITAVHPNVDKRKESKVSEVVPEDLKPLRLSGSLMQEVLENPGVLETLLLITEGFLPFSFVRSRSWRMINRTYAVNALIDSTETLYTKIKLYKKVLNETLQLNLKDTTMVNVHFNIWTSPSNVSFLAVMVSFAPNILNMELLEQANDAKILLNNRGESRNCHLLEFVNLGRKRLTGANIYKVFGDILIRHKLVDKLGIITMNNATNNEPLDKSLFYDYLNKIKPSRYQMLGKVSVIGCANHVLNLIFERIIKTLSEDPRFREVFRKVTKLAEVMRNSTAINASLKERGIPLIPYESETRWINTWRQITVFLQNYPAYSEWFKALDPKSHTHIIKQIQTIIAFDERTIQLLTYFVKCCNIFSDLNSTFQNGEFNNLPQGIPLYYLLSHYYKQCRTALTGNHIPKTSGMDYFNGPESLSMDDKRIVLEAIRESYTYYQDDLSDLEANPLFYVAVILDPTAKQQKLNELMEEADVEFKMSKVNSFIRNFLKVQKLRYDTEEALKALKENRNNDDLLSFNIRLAPDPSKLSPPPPVEAEKNDESLEEWERYQKEPVIPGDSREEAVKWWYDHRHSYPTLFPLAMSLFYTKFTSNDVEKCFSITERLDRPYNDIATMMILRDRFSNFGLYKNGLPSDSILDGDDFDMNLDNNIYTFLPNDSDHEQENSDAMSQES
ncbi:hypothetical protein HG537_0H02090 [Torulaspora globosa]|uniref:BED-type domain-containing protein n=1 Tax=Torulaspora globosa TaxID=48254 RepID=A0A7H9HZU0_9SACH|nr:hypothetical protein HG537_0H02090 [Torulaspora sp. CBS 2947]